MKNLEQKGIVDYVTSYATVATIVAKSVGKLHKPKEEEVL